VEQPRRSERRRSRRRREAGPSLTSLAEASELLDRALALSPADDTEIVWWEVRRSRAAHHLEETDSFLRVERSAMVRVREAGRTGSYRLDRPDLGSLETGIRQAMAHARGAPPSTRPRFPGREEPDPSPRAPFDRRIATLSLEDAHRLLDRRVEEDEAALLEWSEGRVLVANSSKLRRQAKVSTVTVQIRSGQGARAGFSSQSARRLDDLDLERVVQRARRRRASGESESAGRVSLQDTLPLVLSPESTIELVNQLNVHAFGSRAYREGSSFLREHLGVQVFDRAFGLRDDATDPTGLPFPFDLEGRTKVPLELVERGVGRTPTLDLTTAFELGMEPTTHCVGGDEALALNLFMAPGELDERGLLAEVGHGLWVGRLDRVEVFDPHRMLFRARCRGVRRVEEGTILETVPELVWEDSLLRVFSNFIAIGSNPVTRASHDGILGATSAPAVAIAEAATLQPAADR
jgi:predicted Zn-dependent protease